MARSSSKRSGAASPPTRRMRIALRPMCALSSTSGAPPLRARSNLLAPYNPICSPITLYHLDSVKSVPQISSIHGIFSRYHPFTQPVVTTPL